MFKHALTAPQVNLRTDWYSEGDINHDFKAIWLQNANKFLSISNRSAGSKYKPLLNLYSNILPVLGSFSKF